MKYSCRLAQHGVFTMNLCLLLIINPPLAGCPWRHSWHFWPHRSLQRPPLVKARVRGWSCNLFTCCHPNHQLQLCHTCHKGLEASTATFQSLLNPDSAVGVVSFLPPCRLITWCRCESCAVQFSPSSQITVDSRVPRCRTGLTYSCVY